MRPFFYLLQHPDTKVTFKFLGTHHELNIDEIPDWCIDILTNSRVLFHEGKDGIVCADPFNSGKALKVSFDGECYDWLSGITEEEAGIAKEVVRIFYKHVRKQHTNIPELGEIRVWAIVDLLMNFSFFATGKESDYILHQSFKEAGKPIIDLDTTYIEKARGDIDIDEKKLILGSLGCDDFLHYILRRCKKILDTIADPNMVSVESDDDDFFMFEDTMMDIDDFPDMVLMQTEASRLSEEEIVGRNETWVSYINEFLKTFYNQDISCAVICGAGHLPDLFNKLIAKGFTVHEINSDGTTSEFKHKVANYQIEKLVYRQLRAQITGADACSDWMYLLYQQNLAKGIDLPQAKLQHQENSEHTVMQGRNNLLALTL